MHIKFRLSETWHQDKKEDKYSNYASMLIRVKGKKETASADRSSTETVSLT